MITNMQHTAKLGPLVWGNIEVLENTKNLQITAKIRKIGRMSSPAFPLPCSFDALISG